jgi:hypothetical protein
VQVRRALLAGSALILLSLALGGFWLSAGRTSHRAQPPRKPVFPVSGQVLYTGFPAEGAHVYLFPLDSSELDDWPTGFPRGEVSADGSFVLSTYAPGDGAPAGRYLLMVHWKKKHRRAILGREKGKGLPTPWMHGEVEVSQTGALLRVEMSGPENKRPATSRWCARLSTRRTSP